MNGAGEWRNELLVWEQPDCWQHEYVLKSGDVEIARLHLDWRGGGVAIDRDGRWSFTTFNPRWRQVTVDLTRRGGVRTRIGALRRPHEYTKWGTGTLDLPDEAGCVWDAYVARCREAPASKRDRALGTWSAGDRTPLVSFTECPRVSPTGRTVSGKAAYFWQGIRRWIRLRPAPVVPGHDVVVEMSPAGRAHPHIRLLALFGRYLPELNDRLDLASTDDGGGGGGE